MRLKNSPKTGMQYSLVKRVAFSILAIGVVLATIYLYNVYLNPSTSLADKGGKDSSFLEGFTFRQKITIDKTKICGKSNFKDFVFLFSKTDPKLKHTSYGGKVSNLGGSDIAFTDKNGKKVLNSEIEEYNPETGKLVAWVNVHLKHNSTNQLYIYY